MNGVERLRGVQENILKWQKQSPLTAKNITLIAVSKTHPAEAIIPLIEAGQKVFGENRVQEAAEKWPAIREKYPDVQVHLIGSLQSNKTKEALTLFDAIHTVDRQSLVEAIVKESAKLKEVRCKQFFVQVNIGEEEQKGGVAVKDTPELVEYIRAQKAFPLSGLMCVPPVDETPAPYFALLHKMAADLELSNLSMGMSGDYEAAIRLGATHVRVGTALFGERH